MHIAGSRTTPRKRKAHSPSSEGSEGSPGHCKSNEPTNQGLKTPGAYLLLRSHQSFVHSSSYTETQWFSVGPHDRSNSPGEAIERYYYFGAVAGTSGRRFEECNHWLGCFLLEMRMRAVGKQGNFSAPSWRFRLVQFEHRCIGSEFSKNWGSVKLVNLLSRNMFVGRKCWKIGK